MDKYLNKQEQSYLNNLKCGIKKLQEDGDYPRSFKLPVGLQFELTSKCNLKCLHCYNRSGDADKETTMVTQDWINLANQIVKDGGIFQCIISGGEPLLLGDDLFQIMDILHEDKTAFLFISNGYFVTDEIVKKMSKYDFFWIQISIDGCQESFHDNFRGQKGSWEKAVSAAFKFAHNGFPVKIASSVVPENFEQLEEMAELCYRIGASSVIFGEVIPSGRAYDDKTLYLSADQQKEVKKKLSYLRKIFSGKMDIQYSSNEIYQINHNQIMPTQSAIIRPNGDVRLDCIAPFTIGNVHKEKFSDIWKNKSEGIWEDEKIVAYINDFNDNKKSIINHVTDDIVI